jgi:hypothetical protein
MPLRPLLLMLALIGVCVAIICIAWGYGVDLYVFSPAARTRWRQKMWGPPTHPGEILGLLAFAGVLAFFTRRYAFGFFALITVGLLLGTPVGFLVYNWTPTWAQYALTAGMLATCIYAWSMRYYLDD